jgi:predicted transcriptional regulator
MELFKELTKAEDQLMRKLWEMKKGTIKEIVDQMTDPKPAYNTIATVLKVLKTKGFVDFESLNNTYVYYPLIEEKTYTQFAFDKVFTNYFNGSYHRLVSFLVEEKNLDEPMKQELLKLADKLKKD